MKDPNNPCIFCKIRKEELQFENQLAYSTIDSYPVSEFHSLIVPKRHVKTYFELTYEEIILIGSGKGVTSVSKINDLKWKRRKINCYIKLNKIYNSLV